MAQHTDDVPLISVLRAEDVLDALGRAVVATTVDGEILLWNPAAERLYGWSAREVLGRSIFEVLVDVTTRDRGMEIVAGVAAGGEWEGDFDVITRGGLPMQVHTVSRPFYDDEGSIIAVVGVSEDVGPRRWAEAHAADVADHFRLAIQAGNFGTWRWDMATGVTVWDPAMEALFGLGPGTFDGTYDAWAARLYPPDAPGVLASVEDAVACRGSYDIEHRAVWPDGTVRWIQGRGQVTLDADGNVTGTIGCALDVTDRKHAEMERSLLARQSELVAARERSHRERLEFLAHVNDALATTWDRQELMRNVTAAAVPRLGDWCAMYVLPDPDATTPDVEVAHVDPAMAAYALRVEVRFPYDRTATIGVAHVIRTGLTEFHPEVTDELLRGWEDDEEHLDVVRGLTLRSALSVALKSGGRVFGAMQFFMAESDRRYTYDDVALAEAAAGRIGAALENVRLYEEQRTIARTLQASLLPQVLPEVPGVDVAVRYWAAGEATVVGGDFYDLFPLDDERWALVIGDVCGTGPTAAALTGAARHTIRAAARLGADHHEVLNVLNAALLLDDTDLFCTALFATLARERGSWHLTFAAGGHPLPILVDAMGHARSIGDTGSLLGVFDDVSLSVVDEQLSSGDVVVLYTDGVTDVAAPHGLTATEFEAVVSRAVAGAPDASAVVERLREAIEAILPIEGREDDIAIVALAVR